ncbi:hypothetical protein CHU92_04235 [Flavobacterium cyanobacteriorum]|uniref:Repeat protein (TIGR03806 family) n=1 Tax=Flavobacterium cyanobacteriorum TaxID=2022802 RepID=A0A255ZKI1_9FLAO|nr:hypothetical protein [Flavobacterium cyanobacteriorum]OYQ41976.1 hypothetical protein CHU92_04235 [Flavobacterium cyanobacteriorum]
MKKNYAFIIFISVLCVFTILSCSDSEDGGYIPVVPVSPVTVDLTAVPYPKLSDYKFFEGQMKNLQPALDVLPYEPVSSLFSDYAHKKRFVWMPKGTRATYDADGKVLQLPTGAVLIKNFYYDNVQNVPQPGTSRIIETRLMIRKADGWIFADYVWNAEQTEAFYDMAGSYTTVTWKDEANITKTVQYRIPSGEQCFVCHKSSRLVNGAVVTESLPIGIKPQNLNFNYNYTDGPQNQLSKWIAQGYLQDNFAFPSTTNTAINYADASKPLELRARSYVDINCAHCHSADRHCDYRPMRYAFSETGVDITNMGVCVNTEDMQGFSPSLGKIVSGREPENSMMFFRINTTDETFRMPLHGRTLIHDEGINLIRDWINSLDSCE